MRPPAALLALPLLSACRGCGGVDPALREDPSGVWGHETTELQIAAHGDRLVAVYASLYEQGECACLLDLQREQPGLWATELAGQRVELRQDAQGLAIQPPDGQPVTLECCGPAWAGDRAPSASHRPLGRCTTLSQAAAVFLPVPFVEEPEESPWTTIAGDQLEAARAFGAFDVWVLVRLPGPGGFAGLVRIEELDCGA
jgi:hypothetical protein